MAKADKQSYQNLTSATTRGALFGFRFEKAVQEFEEMGRRLGWTREVDDNAFSRATLPNPLTYVIHEELLNKIRDCLIREAGNILIRGESGMGKSALCEALLRDEKLKEYYQIFYVVSKSDLTPYGLYSELLAALGAKIPNSTTAARKLFKQLILEAHKKQGKRSLLLYDEGQRCSDEALLQELQDISDWSVESKPLVTLIVLGDNRTYDVLGFKTVEGLLRLLNTVELRAVAEEELGMTNTYRLKKEEMVNLMAERIRDVVKEKLAETLGTPPDPSEVEGYAIEFAQKKADLFGREFRDLPQLKMLRNRFAYDLEIPPLTLEQAREMLLRCHAYNMGVIGKTPTSIEEQARIEEEISHCNLGSLITDRGVEELFRLSGGNPRDMKLFIQLGLIHLYRENRDPPIDGEDLKNALIQVAA